MYAKEKNLTLEDVINISKFKGLTLDEVYKLLNILNKYGYLHKKGRYEESYIHNIETYKLKEEIDKGHPLIGITKYGDNGINQHAVVIVGYRPNHPDVIKYYDPLEGELVTTKNFHNDFSGAIPVY